MMNLRLVTPVGQTVSHATKGGPMWIILPILALIIIAFLIKALSGRGK